MFDHDLDNTDISPFHTGEKAVQERLGTRNIENWARQVVRPFMPDQHREFHSSLPFLVIAARDKSERPWATLLAGAEGFVTSPDDRHLLIKAQPPKGDGLEEALRPGDDLGILGIEFSSRRRNRVNGHVTNRDSRTISFQVDQSFGNCPQYIQERHWKRVEPAGQPRSHSGYVLNSSQINWISRAKTFFIASGYRGKGIDSAFGMDASHRGGEAGFVEVLDERTIRFPDYSGNNYFNTLGNIELDPRVGLLFLDFSTGSILQLTGSAQIDWDSSQIKQYPGALRLITIALDEVREVSSAVNLRWKAPQENKVKLRLVQKTRESVDVTSFVFEAQNKSPLACFKAGQYLPIVIKHASSNVAVERTYSLSSSSEAETYRISVKREPYGIASRFLHDHLEPGMVLESGAPTGTFTLSQEEQPTVLISAGIGITPLLSMLHELSRKKYTHPIWFFHNARNSEHHVFAKELANLENKKPAIISHVAYSRPLQTDLEGKDYDSIGRINGKLIRDALGEVDAQYYLCGPSGFMASIKKELLDQGVREESIHYEAFGV